MSKLTVPQHLTNSTIFRVWLEEINGIIDEELEIYDILETKAPIAHATEGTMYGLGTPVMYGHLRLTDEMDEELDSTKGTAASPKAIHATYVIITERIDALEEAFYASLQELRVEMQEQIDELNEAVAGKAPIYHASPDETYGKGNGILYGHLRLSDNRSSHGVDDGYAATPLAVQETYEDGKAYVDSFNINERFAAVDLRITENAENIAELDSRLDVAEEEIDDIQDKLVGLETCFFQESISVDASMLQYGAYVFRNSADDATLSLQNVRPHFRISVSNESDHLLYIEPANGYAVNGSTLPVVLGKGDTASFVQNPVSNSGVINWTISARETMLESAPERTLSSICAIDMASEKAEIIEVNGPTSVEFMLGMASAQNRSEYAEKNLLFISNASNSILTWPEGIVWMNAEEAPVWGLADGEMLMIKVYQFGNRIFLEQKHNSHIVPGLDVEVVKRLI